MSDTPPSVSIEPARRTWFTGASIVWLIPLIALAVALFVAWQSYNERGPLIVVEFTDGAGIAAGETELRYRDITIGTVEKLGFTTGLGRVAAYIRVDKGVAPYIDNGSVFWIVQPEVTAQGITGLSTVLSGVYIEGSWDTEIGPPETRFQGASEAPLIRPGRSGLQIALRTSANGDLTDDAPILYRGIEVGRVGRAQISRGGSFAIVEALIFDEHRDLVNSSTRFWDASGFEVSIGPAGAEIDFSSIASLVGGGITFDTFVSGGDRVQDGAVFEIFPDKETARNSLFRSSEVDPLRVSAIFEENVSGLAIGAPVELNGLTIGEVETLAGIVDYDQFGDSRVRLNVTLSIQPARLGLPDEVTAESALAFLENRVANGLRARMASASILTGGLKVELVNIEDAVPARIAVVGSELPLLPTVQGQISDTAATVEGVFTRLNSLPIEELMKSAIEFLDAAEALVSNEDVAGTPRDLRALMADISGLVNSEDVQNVPASLNATLTRIEGLVAELEERQIAERLVGLLENAETAAQSAGAAADAVTASVAGVPALIEQIEAVAAKAGELELNALFDELAALVKSADAIVSADEAAALPGALKGALDEINATLQELREGGAVRNVNQALSSARDAADTIAVSAKDLPQVVERLNSLFAQASRTIEGYNQGDQISRSVQETLRDIQKAADALAKLARTIERNPNSLLLGR